MENVNYCISLKYKYIFLVCLTSLTVNISANKRVECKVNNEKTMYTSYEDELLSTYNKDYYTEIELTDYRMNYSKEKNYIYVKYEIKPRKNYDYKYDGRNRVEKSYLYYKLNSSDEMKVAIMQNKYKYYWECEIPINDNNTKTDNVQIKALLVSIDSYNNIHTGLMDNFFINEESYIIGTNLFTYRNNNQEQLYGELFVNNYGLLGMREGNMVFKVDISEKKKLPLYERTLDLFNTNAMPTFSRYFGITYIAGCENINEFEVIHPVSKSIWIGDPDSSDEHLTKDYVYSDSQINVTCDDNGNIYYILNPEQFTPNLFTGKTAVGFSMVSEQYNAKTSKYIVIYPQYIKCSCSLKNNCHCDLISLGD